METIDTIIEKMHGGTPVNTGKPFANARPKCWLCPNETEGLKYCLDCQQAILNAKSYRSEHCVIPRRYSGARHDGKLALDTSYLLHGLAGTGKTYAAYALIRHAISRDPRLLIAAYSWTTVLMRLRRGYNNKTEEGDVIIDALRKSDLALLDDLGAEKITDSNSGWLREILFVILDDRWANMLTTIVTSNLEPDRLAVYLGDRIMSRVVGMCESIEFTGEDRRLWPANHDEPKGEPDGR